MEQNDRERNDILGDGLGESGAGRHDDAFGTGGSAGAANTPSFGSGTEPVTGIGGMGTAGRGGMDDRAGDALGDLGERASERMEGMRNRVEEQLDQGLRTTADRMESIAQRIDDVADERLSGEGWRGRAGEAAHSVADRVESTASYLRENDAGAVLARLEGQVRERPLEMLLVGVATGWLVGRILR